MSTAMHGTQKIVCDSSCSQSSTLYDLANHQLTINIGGTGDNDVYTFDPATGRMTSYAYTVGATPKTMKGNLAWNANGTLQQLAIADGFNANGTQTCSYVYDDWVRMSSVNCVDPSNTNVWGQNFVYDPYGDITKSVPTGDTGISWACANNLCYDQTKNQYNATLSPSIAYDADGNLLNDTFHAYKWDVYGKLSTIDSNTCGTDGTCLTYDGLGRVIEKNVGGVFSQILYSPVGKTAIMSGQTTTQSYIPLPGGATEFESSSNGRSHIFWHKDWLGSVRLASRVVSQVATVDRAFAPFGEMYKPMIGGTANQNFTGDTQDLIAGLFDTPNRELNPNQGRWISPDPAGLAAVDPTNPQTFNRYAYVGNSPLAAVDPLGLVTGVGGGGGGGGDGPSGDLPYNWFYVSVDASPLIYRGGGEGGGGDGTRKDSPPPTNCMPGTKGCFNVPTVQQQCPTVPQAPPGVDINSNISNAKWAQLITYIDPALSLGAFYLEVRNHSPMDYKQQGWTLTDTGQLGPSPFQDFGNFNYGAVGSAWGIPQDALLRGAGYAQEHAGTQDPSGAWGHWYQGPPYGDDPADQKQILQGIQYYQNGCYNSPNPQ